MEIPATASKILDREKIRLKLERMAFQAMEMTYGNKELVLIGIEDGGYALAEQMGALIRENSQKKVQIISLYINKRDPLKEEIRLGTNIDLDGKVVIVVDDVGNTGKTLFYAMKPLIAAQPQKILIAVLLERMHKAFPVKADIVGFPIASTYNEHIIVQFRKGEAEGAYLF